MSDMEKTISRLKEIADYFHECRSNASLGSKAEEHFWELQSAARDAVEMLTEQEPRVLTPDEIIKHEGYVWKEYKSMHVMTVVEIRKGMELIPYESPYPTKELNWSSYQKEWRCWTAQPTDEQRKTVKWDEKTDH